MSHFESLPMISPDGRFAIRIDEMQDRSTIDVKTTLTNLATGQDIAWLGTEIHAGFQSDGMVRVTHLAWSANDVLIDPAKACFRVRDDQPWIPLTAWGIADAAYRRGWADGLDFLGSDAAFGIPWTFIGIAVGAFALVAFLAWSPSIPLVPRMTLIIIGALVTILFLFLSANQTRNWQLLRKRRVRR
jgi:hypothetical protein